ncbi:MAG: 4Fe-4S dicluster domain-containing protein [Candidatus Micrarchaeales archaeon]|jgi:Fe-S-cluster-containing hydrogenase component 2
MDVYVEKEKCTGCQHCKDVCPVAVFEMKGRGDQGSPDSEGANSDHAPDEHKWKGTTLPEIVSKWSSAQDGHKHFAKENDGTSGGLSDAVNGPSCILCQACLIECEGECIVISDDSGNTYKSIYK